MIKDVREIKIIGVQHTDGEKQITSYYLKDGTHLKDLEIVRPKMSFKIDPGSLTTNFDSVFNNVAHTPFRNTADAQFTNITNIIGDNPKNDDVLVDFVKSLADQHKIEVQVPKEKPE